MERHSIDHVNAEAGPSRLSTSSTPVTPSKSTRRRSWFGFASPSNLMTTSLSTTTPPKPRKGSRGGDSIASLGAGEEVELKEAGPSRARVGDDQQATSPRREKAAVDNDGVEELDIDGTVVDKTIRKKKSKRRSAKKDDDGEVVRLQDLSGKSSRGTMRRAYDPGGDEKGNMTFAPRTFARTASDRSAFTFDPPQRTSSLASPPIPIASPSLHSVSSPRLDQQPSSFTDADRPLPPLPPLANDNKALPDVPRGIVVTPSSPRKLSKRRPATGQASGSSSSSSLGKNEKRGRSSSQSRPKSRDSSRTRTLRTVKSFNIGLGLPHTQPAQTADGDTPPAIPNKAQSVSSPLPSRGSSPTPRIVFAEPEIRQEKLVERSEVETEKKGRMKRARSLSGALKRSPLVGSNPNSRSTTPEPKDEDESEEVTVKAAGVLGWLGVKKTVKRRTSETQLKPMEHHAGSGPVRPVSPATIGSDAIPRKSRDSLGPHDQVDEKIKARRPDIDAHASSITVHPDSATRRSIFGRRSSSRGSQHDEPSSPRRRPVPITINPGRPSTANSSRSSLNFAHSDAVSPGLVQSDRWPESPIDAEETLFSPEGSATWGPGIRPWMDGTEGRRSNRSSVSSPLGSLPEQGLLTTPKPPLLAQTGRLRSWSDAPLPQNASKPVNNSNPHLPADESLSKSLQPSTHIPTRPKLPGRSSSGNSVLMGKVRSVFAKTTSRGRSQTLLRQPSSDMDEFGSLKSQSDYPRAITMRPSSSSSSTMSRPASGILFDSPRTALLGLANAERSIFLNETPERSPRTSIAGASISSLQSGTTRSRLDPAPKRTGRARASTMFSGPSSSQFLPPPSPQVFPAAATPPRRRPSVIQRLSSGVLRSGPSSPRTGSGSLFPLPPRSSGSMSSSFTSPLGPEDSASSMTSPRPSAGSISAAVGTLSLKKIAAREADEQPEKWLERVTSLIGRSEIANVLAESGDEFHSKALRLYMSRFDFTHNALDVALRRLLMDMSLPRETQQIDRIIEAFAVRYEECEPGLFIQKDNTYVLAFSMMMLHTDAFNRHNKNKMTKADYVRNTRMEGVPPLVLEAFFDNITFTPFVFIEDEAELSRVSEPPSSATTITTVTSSQLTPGPKNGKIDVYHMIVGDLLQSLQLNLEHEIPAESPFSCLGTRPLLDTDILHQAFVQARSMVIVPPKRKNSAAALLGSTPSREKHTPENETILKVTKVGLLSRRDDVSEGGKKSGRKWRSWSVILTGSQLLFFKDPTWALTLLEQMAHLKTTHEGNSELLPRMTNFKPDEVLPLQNAVAIYDRSYTQLPNTFRFVMSGHRQYLLQASDEFEMNEWINLINYGSSFKSANVRIRGTAMDKDRAVLAGAAAAASHKRQTQINVHHGSPGGPPQTPRKMVVGDAETQRQDLLSPVSLSVDTNGTTKAKGKIDVDGANDVVNEGEQLEEVFDVVKAELAAGRGGAAKRVDAPVVDTAAVQPTVKARGHTSRAEQIQTQIKQIENKARAAKATLASNLRIARNYAILTPFQKTTRDRIAAGVPSLAAKVRTNRLDLAKYNIWIETLRRDLVHEQREMARLRHVALQAAAKSLRDPLGVRGVVEDINADDPGVPVLALPDDGPSFEMPHEGINAGRKSGESGRSSISDTDNQLARSQGELPVMFRRSSDEPRTQAQSEIRPALPRQSSVASYKSTATSNSDLKRTSSDLLMVKDAMSRPQTPRLDQANGRGGSDTGRSTPVLFPLEVEDDQTISAHHGIQRDGLGIDFHTSTKNDNDHESSSVKTRMSDGPSAEAKEGEEVPEEWMKTRAARRVSLATLPDLHRLQGRDLTMTGKAGE